MDCLALITGPDAIHILLHMVGPLPFPVLLREMSGSVAAAPYSLPWKTLGARSVMHLCLMGLLKTSKDELRALF